ncbi:MAG: ADOP family duplicated permease [Opitutaceae bacterium]
MIQNLRYALRQFRQSPGFTAVAVLTLALAIGLNTAAFSLVHGLLFRPLFTRAPAEVVNLFTADRSAHPQYRSFSHAEYRLLREDSDTFAEVAASLPELAVVGADSAAQNSPITYISEDYFALLGVAPAAGRFFSAEECRPGAGLALAVASHALWQRLGGRSDFVGTSLRVDGRSCIVVGIVGPGFRGLNALGAPELWLPLGAASANLTAPGETPLRLTARLAAGISPEAAGARLPALAARLDKIQPPGAEAARVLAIQAPSRFSEGDSPAQNDSGAFALLALPALAGGVLLIACLNLANLFLAHSTSRSRATAVRLALGSGRWPIIRQLLVEGLLVSFAGGLLGLLLASWANALLARTLASVSATMQLPLSPDLRLDGAAYLATGLLSLAATLCLTLLPALRASRIDPLEGLRQSGTAAAGGHRFNRFFAPRNCLVMVQMALALVLLFASGLFLRSAIAAAGLDLGFEPKGVVVARIDATATETTRARLDLLARINALPGVRAASASSLLPYGNLHQSRRIQRSDTPLVADRDESTVGCLLTAASPGYFATLGVRLLQGRDFSETEAGDPAAPAVAIVDEALARKLFPAGDALGRSIRFAGQPQELEIVGICAPHRHALLEKASRSHHLFVPAAKAPTTHAYLAVRLAGTAPAAVAAFTGTLRDALRRFAPELGAPTVTTFEDFLGHDVGLWATRFLLVAFGAFGVLALILATLGVYGISSYAATCRTREFGIRLALGASRSDIDRLVLRQRLLQTTLGLGAGLVLSLGVAQLLSRLIYHVSAVDPLTIGWTTALLAAAALLAAWLPARRASRVDPLEALRAE